MKVGPYEIKARDEIPPLGLKFFPTLEPELSDDADTYPGRRGHGGGPDVSACNKAVIRESIKAANAIVEIGVAKQQDGASILLMEEKHPDCIYIGIDIEDKSMFHNPSKHIYILQGDSARREPCWKLMNELEVKGIDLLFIDGWHSVNQCVADWRYTEGLSDHGIVLLHDTNYHPGPVALYEAINENEWLKFQVCPHENDYGLALCTRR